MKEEQSELIKKADEVYEELESAFVYPGRSGQKSARELVTELVAASYEHQHGLKMIKRERVEHFTKHGRTLEMDAEKNKEYQLTAAAMMLLMQTPGSADPMQSVEKIIEAGSFDEPLIRTMMAKPYEKRLVIAGSLIAAELDRLKFG